MSESTAKILCMGISNDVRSPLATQMNARSDQSVLDGVEHNAVDDLVHPTKQYVNGLASGDNVINLRSPTGLAPLEIYNQSQGDHEVEHRGDGQTRREQPLSYPLATSFDQ